MLSVNACARGRVLMLLFTYCRYTSGVARPCSPPSCDACRPMPEVTRAPEAVCKRLTGISRVPHAVETPSQTVATRGERGPGKSSEWGRADSVPCSLVLLASFDNGSASASVCLFSSIWLRRVAHARTCSTPNSYLSFAH